MGFWDYLTRMSNINDTFANVIENAKLQALVSEANVAAVLKGAVLPALVTPHVQEKLEGAKDALNKAILALEEVKEIVLVS